MGREGGESGEDRWREWCSCLSSCAHAVLVVPLLCGLVVVYWFCILVVVLLSHILVVLWSCVIVTYRCRIHCLLWVCRVVVMVIVVWLWLWMWCGRCVVVWWCGGGVHEVNDDDE